MSDAVLKKKLAEEHSWIAPLYAQTSDFVHLSFRPLFAAITRTDAETRMATMAISGTDPVQDESAYYEICNAFLRVSHLASVTILGVLTARHRADAVATEETGDA